MELKTHSGDKEIIYANTLMPFSNKNNRLQIELYPKMILELRFTDNSDSIHENKINISVDEKTNVMIIEAINFKNSIGTCTSEPIKLGMIENKDIFLNFASYDISGNKVVHIILYRQV